MAILTESKIRKLLKTTDLKQTKQLVLEPGTIITPSARGYLNDMTIIYGDEEPQDSKSEAPAESALPIQVKPKLDRKENRIAKNWRLEVDKQLSFILQKQVQGFQQNRMELVAELAVIVTILKDLREMDGDGSYTIAESFGSTVQEVQEKYSQLTYIPAYTAGEWVIQFYDCFIQMRTLENQAEQQLQTYLLDEEYQKITSHIRLLIDYTWLLMVKQIETKNKGGEKAHAIG